MDHPSDHRTPDVDVAPPGPSADDLRRLRIHRTPPSRDVPYVPTEEPVVAAMLRFASITEKDLVYDLGCGDGRLVIAAARQCGARGVGIDIDPLRIQESRENAKKARITDRVQFHCASFFDVDLSKATVLLLYLLTSINVKLRPKLMGEMKPGSRIVVNHFDMGDWPADMEAYAHHRVLKQWIIPAWVGGTWKCVIDEPGDRTRVVLRLRRRYQTVTGTAHLKGREFVVTNGRLFGEYVTFKLIDLKRRPSTMHFNGRVEGTIIRGTCRRGLDGPTITWGGIWKEVHG